MFKLYDYQIKLVERSRDAYKHGYKAPCIVSPCGSGKSVVIAEIARMTAANRKNILFLVHRRELVDQIRNTFIANKVDLNFVRFGMVQTIVKRLDKIERPSLIITDESHHALAKTYKKIYEYFPDVLRLSFTATPVRLNGDGLGAVNDVLIEEVNAKWLIEHGFLSPYKYFAPKLINENYLKLNRLHEFSNASINNSMRSVIYGDVIAHYQKLAPGEKAIVYCHNIDASKKIESEFNQAGIKTAHIDAKTHKKERDEIINKFRSNEIQILTNVDLIGEGFDVPDCSTVIMLRPTQSLSLFIQQSMRGMRYRPGKTSIIIDHVNNIQRFGLPDDEREWTLDGLKKKRQEPGNVHIKQCNNCFAVYTVNKKKCPECGYIPPVVCNEIENDTTAELVEVDSSFTLDFRTPRDCKNMNDLYELAKHRGYKKGWAYIQGKRRGFIK